MTERRKSYSRISTCALCPRKYYLTERWDRKVKPAALSEGTIVHAVLSRMYDTQDLGDWEVMMDDLSSEYVKAAKLKSDEEAESLFSKLKQARAVLSVYVSRIATKDFERFKTLEVEQPHELHLPGGIVIPGISDAVVEDRHNGRKYLMEHKYKADHDETMSDLELQPSLYTLAKAKKYGAILPTLYNVLRKPMLRVSKKGGDVYNRALEAIVEEMKTFTYGVEFSNRYFIRRVYHRGRRLLENAVNDTTAIIEHMELIDREGERRAYRNVGQQCSWCSHRAICPSEDPLIAEGMFVRRDNGKKRI